ncbi:unnamed protein product [Toxocara canis]|uniref:BEACH domain-containing protein n=1 Tax=Toxocara canis TaxID=6265 RepID=A0A183UHC9_TOXCA|nr:unnamed protein product [Toxocara canis]
MGGGCPGCIWLFEDTLMLSNHCLLFEENGVTYYGEAAIAKQMQHYSAISEPDNLIQCSANEIQQRSMHFDVNSPMSLTSFDGPVAISAEAPLQASLVPREEPNMEWNRTSDMWMGPPPTFQQPADQQTTVIPVVSPPFTVFPGLQFLTSSNGFPARTRSFTHTFQQKSLLQLKTPFPPVFYPLFIVSWETGGRDGQWIAHLMK